ncbi:MAG: iron-containing alcohol dehydrogenase [Polyangiales bacterium]
MAAGYYEFFCPVKVVSGHKALEHAAYELSALGSSRPMIVTDKGVRGAGLVDVVIAALETGGAKIAEIHDEVPPDSSTTVVTEIARAYRKSGADAIVAIGGGSVIDTAKAVNILVSEGGDDIRAYSGVNIVKHRLKPFFVLPTTSGTGSEVTSVSVVRDSERGVKLPFMSQFLLPDVAILDPRLTLGLPPYFTAATGMDALTHAVESFICLAKNPISDAYASGAVKKIAANLVKVLETPKDADGRLELAQAATMAGIAFSNSMVGLVHSLGHSVGAICHVPHGVCMSILLPFVLEHNLESRREAIGELLLPLAGADVYAKTPADKRAEEAILRIRTLRERLFELAKLPRTLSETGKVERSQLAAIAKLALDDGSILMNPVEVSYKDALAVLEKAF